ILLVLRPATDEPHIDLHEFINIVQRYSAVVIAVFSRVTVFVDAKIRRRIIVLLPLVRSPDRFLSVRSLSFCSAIAKLPKKFAYSYALIVACGCAVGDDISVVVKGGV